MSRPVVWARRRLRLRRSTVRRVRSEWRLIVSFARRTLNATYRQSALALLWTLLQPIALVAVYAIVFSQILKVEGEGLPYLSFVVCGLVIWRFFSAGLNQATAFRDRADTLGKAHFRREVIPLSGCLAAMVDLVVGVGVMIFVAWSQGIPPSLPLLALPAVMLVLVLYASATAVLVSTVTVFVRDLAHAMPTINQVLFLGSPVLYPNSQIPQNLQFLSRANPVAVVAQATREATLEGVWPDARLLLMHVVIGALFFAGSIAYLRSIEDRIVDVV